LNELVKERRGVKPRFSRCHILKALQVLLEHEPIGRPTLKKLLSLGETSTKNMIKRLRELKLVEVDIVGGSYLTDRGREIAELLVGALKPLPKMKIDSSIAPWRASSTWLLKHLGTLVRTDNIVKIRDEAIKAGVEGVVILIYKKESLIMPTSSKLEHVTGVIIPKNCSHMLEDGDMITIVGSSTQDPYVHCEAVLNIVDYFCRSSTEPHV